MMEGVRSIGDGESRDAKYVEAFGISGVGAETKGAGDTKVDKVLRSSGDGAGTESAEHVNVAEITGALSGVAGTKATGYANVAEMSRVIGGAAETETETKDDQHGQIVAKMSGKLGALGNVAETKATGHAKTNEMPKIFREVVETNDTGHTEVGAEMSARPGNVAGTKKTRYAMVNEMPRIFRDLAEIEDARHAQADAETSGRSVNSENIAETEIAEHTKAVAEPPGILGDVDFHGFDDPEDNSYLPMINDQDMLGDTKGTSSGKDPTNAVESTYRLGQDGSKVFTLGQAAAENSSNSHVLLDSAMDIDEFDTPNIRGSSQLSRIQRSPTTATPLPSSMNSLIGDGSRLMQDVDMTDAVPTTDLTQYRPIAELPPLRGRTCKTPEAAGSGWSVSPTWPPPKPHRGMPSVRPDVVPPEGAPLHVHIQAYALRWGTWATEVKDDTLREQLLKWVTDKMRESWDTAIKEGYYPRPDGVLIQAETGPSGSDEQPKQRGRKRAQGPSKQQAPFAREGKDPVAVTNAELAAVGVTMEMINDRVAEKDFEAGELLLDEVLSNLGKDKIEVKDWSRTSPKPTVVGRNFLMYSLYAVQEAREEVKKLQRLYAHFTKDVQKKNTLARIDLYRERANQFLALATEIQLSRLENGNSETETQQDDVEEAEQVDLTSDSSSVEVIDEEEQSTEETPKLAKDAIFDLAKDVLLATDENALIACFTSRGLEAEDFNSSTTQKNSDSHVEEARRLLEQVHSYMTRVVQIRQAMSKTFLPADKIRYGHDARLMKERIGIAQGKLRTLLTSGFGAQVYPANAAQSPDTKIVTDSREPDAQYSRDFSYDHFNAATPSLLQSPTPSPSLHQLSPLNAEVNLAPVSTPQSAQDSRSASELQSIVTDPRIQEKNPSSSIPSSIEQEQASEYNAMADQKDQESTAKQAYIDQQYRPWLNEMFTKHQLPLIAGTLSGWNDIKECLTQLDFSSKDRNIELRRFKAGFEEWYAKNKKSLPQAGMGTRRPSSEPQTPAAAAAAVLTPIIIPATAQLVQQPPAIASMTLPPPRTQTPMPTSPAFGQPSDAEILAAIPPTGVHGSVLGSMFIQRFSGNFPALVETVQRIAYIGAENMIYPPRTQPIHPHMHGHTQSQYHQPQAILPMNRHSLAQHPSQFGPYNTVPQTIAPNQTSLSIPNNKQATIIPAWPSPATPTPTGPYSPQHPHPTQPQPQQPSATFPPHQILTLKLPSSTNPPTSSPMPKHLSSREISSSRGFTFRHLPHATLDQRTRMDDHVASYIARTIKDVRTRKSRFGKYVTFCDPEDPAGMVVMHGVWDLDGKGGRRGDLGWFYGGGDVPEDWDWGETRSGSVGVKEDGEADGEGKRVGKTKLRLNVGGAGVQEQQNQKQKQHGYAAYLRGDQDGTSSGAAPAPATATMPAPPKKGTKRTRATATAATTGAQTQTQTQAAGGSGKKNKRRRTTYAGSAGSSSAARGGSGAAGGGSGNRDEDDEDGDYDPRLDF